MRMQKQMVESFQVTHRAFTKNLIDSLTQLENAIEADRPCKYCWKRACPKGMDCLARISVADVKTRLQQLL